MNRKEHDSNHMSHVSFFLRVSPEKIWYLKFLLEGHDGLALVSTIDRGSGLVRLVTSKGRYKEAMQLVQNLAEELLPRLMR